MMYIGHASFHGWCHSLWGPRTGLSYSALFASDTAQLRASIDGALEGFHDVDTMLQFHTRARAVMKVRYLRPIAKLRRAKKLSKDFTSSLAGDVSVTFSIKSASSAKLALSRRFILRKSVPDFSYPQALSSWQTRSRSKPQSRRVARRVRFWLTRVGDRRCAFAVVADFPDDLQEWTFKACATWVV